MVYFHDKTGRDSRAINSRRGDFQELSKSLRDGDSNVRKQAKKGIAKLKKERGNGMVLSMRQSLINAHREGKVEEVKDIQDIVSKKSKYRNE